MELTLVELFTHSARLIYGTLQTEMKYYLPVCDTLLNFNVVIPLIHGLYIQLKSINFYSHTHSYFIFLAKLIC